MNELNSPLLTVCSYIFVEPLITVYVLTSLGLFCRCGYEFCYTCGAEWKNKKATCSCPIWDEENIVDTEEDDDDDGFEDEDVVVLADNDDEEYDSEDEYYF